MDRMPRTAAAGSASQSDQRSTSAWPKLPVHKLDSATQATAASTPATAPAMVLPGLTLGASLRLPKARPAKYAAMSATHTSASSDTTKTPPRAMNNRASTAHAARTAGTLNSDHATLAGGASARPRTTAVLAPSSHASATSGTSQRTTAA